jgi:hypothetical protein
MDLLKLGMGALVSFMGLWELALAVPVVLTGQTVLPWPAMPTRKGWRGGIPRGARVSRAQRMVSIGNILVGMAALFIGPALVPGIALRVQRGLLWWPGLALVWAGLIVEVVALVAVFGVALRARMLRGDAE